MITVDGSAAESNGFDNDNYINASSNDSENENTPLDVIKLLMASLDKTTLKKGSDILDEAIQNSSPFISTSDAINHFMSDLNSNDSDTFLINYCGIILKNSDTGAITGYDAGGSTYKKANSIVLEDNYLDTTFTDNSFSIDGLTVNLSKNFSLLTDSQKAIWQGLHSWWISGALNLITESYGSNFSFGSESSATTKKINVNFYNKNDNVLASVTHYYSPSSGITSSLLLNINMNYYGSITIENIDPNGTSSTTSAYLDRTIAHEFTHAVMAANINYFNNLPNFFVEGMAELTHGIDDLRSGSIKYLVNNPSILNRVLVKGYNKSDYAYAGGYMFLRYLAKQSAEWDYSRLIGTKLKDTLRNHHNEVTIQGLAGNDLIENNGSYVTIIAGLGNDTIKGEGTEQLIQYANGDGADVVNNFNVETDILNITEGTISTAILNKNNVILKVGKGSITLKNTKGLFVNVLDSEGNMSRKIYGNGNVTVEGTAQNETITAWAKGDSINAYEGDDTLIGGKGNDTLTGGEGADVFFYSNGDGADVITDYDIDEDIIKLNSGAISKVSTIKNNTTDIVLNVGKGSIKLLNGIGKKLTIIDKDDKILRQTFGTEYVNIEDEDGATINTAIDSVVVTVDASDRNTNVTLINNAKNNIIKTGSGDDVITTGKGKDTIEYFGGDDTITDYTVGQDVIKFNDDLIEAKFIGDSRDLIFTTEKGTLTVMNIKTKKKVAQKVTVIDKNDVLYSQVYGASTITLTNNDSDTMDASTSYNSELVKINAAKRSAKKPIYIIGNTQNNTLFGGAGSDTLEVYSGNNYLIGGAGDDSMIGGTDYDTLLGGVGNDTLQSDFGNNYLNGGAGNDLLIGGSGADTLLGEAGNDTLVAYSGDNYLSGGAGNDSMIGGIGSDTFDLGTGNDNVILSTESERGTATIIYTSGKDVVANFKKTDNLNLAKGIKISSATRNILNDDEISYTLNMVNNSKKSVGTLTISGDEYDTIAGEPTTTINKKTKVSTTTTNYYVKFGTHDIIYQTDKETSSTVSQAAYTELFIDDIAMTNEVESILDNKNSNDIDINYDFELEDMNKKLELVLNFQKKKNN